MTENQNMEKGEIRTSESQQLSNREIFKKIIKYVQENVGAFTFLTASTVAVGSAVIRCVMYLLEYGKIIYYNVSPLLIDVSGDNILYDFFVKGIVALILILFNLIPYVLWKGNKKVLIKIGLSILIAASPNILIIFALLSDAFHGINYSISDIVISVLFGIFFGVVFFFLGLFSGICECISMSKQKKEAENKEKNATEDKTKKDEKILTVSKSINKFIVQMAAIFVVELILLIIAGWNIAASQNHFKIINSGDDTCYAVIYENPNIYVITECKIEGECITFPNRDTHQEIDRDGVEYKWQRVMQKR